MTLDDHIFKDVFFGPNSSFNSPLTPISKMVSSSIAHLAEINFLAIDLLCINIIGDNRVFIFLTRQQCARKLADKSSLIKSCLINNKLIHRAQFDIEDKKIKETISSWKCIYNMCIRTKRTIWFTCVL